MFRKKTKRVVTKLDQQDILENHAPTIKDVMTVADGMRVEASRIYISPSGFTKIYYVTALPNIVQFGYLDRFFQVGADVHVTMHVEPADTAKAISKRTKMMTQLKSEIMLEDKAGTNKHIAYNQQMYALLDEERTALNMRQERLFYVTILFSVSSPSEMEFQSACQRIEREGFSGFLVREAYLEHDIGFRAVAPLGDNALKHSIEMTSTALANAFPFNNSRFSHEYGVPIGIDFSTGHLNRYDAWERHVNNANAIIVGASGAGKSWLVKGFVARSAAFGIRHVIVDYEGEYRSLTRALGGVSIRIDAHSPYKFNPFELEDEETEAEDGSMRPTLEVIEKIADMERLITSMAQLYGGELIGSYAAAALNTLLQELYQDHFGFVEGDAESLYQMLSDWTRDARGNRLVNRIKRPQPQFGDFYNLLLERSKNDPQLVDLTMRLRRFFAGGTEGMFDTQTVLPDNLQGHQLQDAHIIHFDLSSLPEKSMARQLGMQVVLEWVLERFVKNKRNIKVRKRVVVDEAQLMLEQEEHAKFIDNVFRRIRKRSGSAVAATQDFRKFADNEWGRAIVQNSETKVLLKQDKNDKDAVMKTFGLEEREFEDLLGYTDGQARWMVGQEIFYNQLVAFEGEVELLDTRFVKSELELARERRSMAR